MCGIFGFVISRPEKWQDKQIGEIIRRFCLLSETRGKDASGLVVATKKQIHVLKRPLRAKKMLKSKAYSQFFNHIKTAFLEDSPVVMMGHTRMVTNGNAETHENNQPTIRKQIVCIHNGIVVNDGELWKQHHGLNRKYEVDTEIILSLLHEKLKAGHGLIPAIQDVFHEIKGGNSIAALPATFNAIVLATTNGSLFTAVSQNNSTICFSSEKYILEQVITHRNLSSGFPSAKINQVKPGTGSVIKTSGEKIISHEFSLSGSIPEKYDFERNSERTILDLAPNAAPKLPVVKKSNYSELEKLCKIEHHKIHALKRCSKCLLPETFPYIQYDEEGVCNYCHNYVYWHKKDESELKAKLDSIRAADGSPDCLVPISGGRDSCYALHYIVNELKMNPVAYTYDWGMVTDLARRNISRMCGDLGIEHILISADIAQKRVNIRKNVLAWLKKPHLGSVTLFMAGDKPYFYYSYMLRRQMGLKLSILGDNHLENTDFKVGFCNIAKSSKNKQHFQLSMMNKVQLLSFFGMRFLENPSYFNSTLIDSSFGFASYYILPADYVSLYDYIPWNEENISQTLIEQYDWETANDTASTWRIGDGTASFYNYIYYKVAGFSENDTFRSNQVREGVLDRETAWEIVKTDNRPRVESINWYCDTIGVDSTKAIARINQIPTLYS